VIDVVMAEVDRDVSSVLDSVAAAIDAVSPSS
jgi:hypothetical protein